MGTKRTLKAMQDLVDGKDLSEDADLGFYFASLVYNLCSSREDKVRPKRKEYPFNELNDEDLNELEQLYEKLPEQSRPEKNGDIDAGSPQLAQQLRDWCLRDSPDAKCGARQAAGSSAHPNISPVVGQLARCALGGSVRTKNIVALTMKRLATEQETRRYLVSSGAVRALLGLVDLVEEKARDAARQALAQICIVTNPSVFPYSEALDMVRPLVQLLEHTHELMQFEGAMALTNLLTLNEELRARAIQADGWRLTRDLLFSENEEVQRVGLEMMCNLTMSPEIVEKFMEGQCELESKVLLAFSLAENQRMQVAATGALAMLSMYEKVGGHLCAGENFGNLFTLCEESDDADVQHRLMTILCNVHDDAGASDEVRTRIRKAVRAKLDAYGFVSTKAAGMARQMLEN